MTPKPTEDELITKLRLESNDNRKDIKYLRQSVDTMTKKQDKLESKMDVIADGINKFQFATVAEVEALEAKIDKRLEGYVTKADFTPFKATLLFIATGVGGVLITLVVSRILQL